MNEKNDFHIDQDTSAPVAKESVKSKRGFASMNKEQQRAIASKGGKAAHAYGVAHEWTSSEAAKAGRIGGKSKRVKPRRVK